ncbi:hypothetical protein [Rhodococcus sp. BH5]|uniref:hypothetical protein n=1 Tax=Rhodococcus sp. BH5 TaxID=2871702 RepID=UPI0022CDA487|nr:hypothetical protein [Rhodococcus sp. BH5]MCZ9634683.1 IS110 family transposase [Rhodococcus sp. BH5]
MNLNDPMLGMLATTVDDLEALKTASENRLRQLTRVGLDKDGEERGFGLDDNHPSVKTQRIVLENITIAHDKSVLNLTRAMKAHPLGPWVKSQKGLGEKTVARLLASIGDPYWMVRHEKQGDNLVVIEDRPRTVSELWAYCGLDPRNGSARKRTKGELANWKGEAKMRCWNVVQPIIKCADSPYRKMYDELKESMQGAVYSEAYEGRMFKNKPIEVGQPLSKGHIEARVQRRLMKEILKDLWVESKRLHDLADAEILVAA